MLKKRMDRGHVYLIMLLQEVSPGLALHHNLTPPTSGRILIATTQAQHQVEGRLLLDVVVGQSATVLQLLAGKDQALLVWRDTLLVLDLALDILNCVG